MNAHFSEDVLREDLEHLANRPATGIASEAAACQSGAEARFDADNTVQRLAYLAHLTREPTN